VGVKNEWFPQTKPVAVNSPLPVPSSKWSTIRQSTMHPITQNEQKIKKPHIITSYALK